MTDVRSKFLDTASSYLKTQRGLIVDGKMPDGSPIEDFEAPSMDFQRGYLIGERAAATAFLSFTDSREGNGAQFRITDVSGEVVTFYPKDNLDGIPSKSEAGEDVYVDGLITALFDSVSS